jgi:hypothetical protein
MNKNGYYVIINTEDNKLNLNVFENSEPYFKYTIIPKRINNNTVVFSIDDIIPYGNDTDGVIFLTAMALLYYIACININIFDNLTTYKQDDDTLFGISNKCAPKAFNSTTSFIESLHLENILTDCDEDDTLIDFNIINMIDNNITFDLIGLQWIYSLFLMDSIIQINFRN